MEGQEGQRDKRGGGREPRGTEGQEGQRAERGQKAEWVGGLKRAEGQERERKEGRIADRDGTCGV